MNGFFRRPTDQPPHATNASNIPSKPGRPLTQGRIQGATDRKDGKGEVGGRTESGKRKAEDEDEDEDEDEEEVEH